MMEVLRTNDPVRLSYAMTLLEDGGCYPFCADRFMASTEGSISALERRIMVPDEHVEKARKILLTLDEPHPSPDEGDDEGDS